MYNVHKNNCPSYLTNHFQVQRYNLHNYDVNNFIKMCENRDSCIIGLCETWLEGNVPNMSPFGSSDHNMICMIPVASPAM